MIEGLSPYAEMKPSGLPWLGDVPAHWDVLRSKYAFREVDSRSTTGEETHLSMSQRLGLVPASQVEKSLVSESYVGAKLVEEDDLVLNRLKAHLGVFAYAKQPGLISPDYTVLRPMPCASVRFFEYVLKSPACRAELRTRAKGIVEGFWRLYTDDFYDIRLPVPPLVEQRLIVRFLDWHGAQTAKLIRAKKKIIALLNEQKQAIIHRAVTRGLDPSVELKPSQISWLGDVPKHWALSKLKHCVRASLAYGVLKPDKYGDFDGVPIIRILDVQDGFIRLEQLEKISPQQDREYHRTRVSAGDVIISIVGTIGRSAVIPASLGIANLSRALCRVQTSPVLMPEFLHLFCLSRAFLDQADRIPAGTAQRVLNLGDLKQFDICLPPPDEQRRIVSDLQSSISPFNDAFQRTRTEMNLIQEFRSCLIAGVVTGKLDVRAAAASLPETIEPEPTDQLVEVDDLDEALDEAENEEVAA